MGCWLAAAGCGGDAGSESSNVSAQGADEPAEANGPGAAESPVDPILETGLDADGMYVAAIPFTVDEDVLLHGEDRYAVHCRSCHGESGDGRGPYFQGAGKVSSDLRQERIVLQPDGQIFGTITHGLGLMLGYGHRIPPRDRWAIIAHVRTLQQAAAAADDPM